MKAFLLAAGTGTRLRPLTDKIPKCLAPILGKPLLQIWLEHLKHCGVEEVLINTHHHAGQVEEFIGRLDGEYHVRLVYEPVLLGSGGTVWNNRDFVSHDENFWIIYGDNLSSINIKAMQEFHYSHKGIITMGLFRPERPRECGIVLLDDKNKVLEFEEKPAFPKSNLANAGIYLVNKRIFQEAKWDMAEPLDFGYHILPQLIGKMYGFVIEDYHLDIGTLANYEKAQRERPEGLIDRIDLKS